VERTHKRVEDDENSRKIVHPRSDQLSTHGNECISEGIEFDYSRATNSQSRIE